MKNPAKTPFEYVVNVTRIVLVLLLLCSTGKTFVLISPRTTTQCALKGCSRKVNAVVLAVDEAGDVELAVANGGDVLFPRMKNRCVWLCVFVD